MSIVGAGTNHTSTSAAVVLGRQLNENPARPCTAVCGGNPLWMYQARRTLLSFGHATWGRRWRSWL